MFLIPTCFPWVVLLADRLFVTPLWLSGIDQFPTQVIVSSLSVSSFGYKVECDEGFNCNLCLHQNTADIMVVSPFPGKLSAFVF